MTPCSFVFLQVAKGVSQALNNVVNCLPGQRDVDEAIEGINRVSAVLAESEPTVTINWYYLSHI